MRYILYLTLFLLPCFASAQQRDGHFADYAAYDSFVTTAVTTRNFRDMVQVLGGRDEYSPEELTEAVTQLMSLFPMDFTHAAVIRAVDLGNGFRQEARVFWSQPQGQYFYYYAVLHQRDDALVVLTFSANTDIDRIMELF